ncbi:MAG: nucleotidyl transferase AbiEii/AbiGii toxin family protein [Planctomycetes bacterium]|nr:nucleotidyl transferase AbiEii/AbiGii toxin family protein [Planctomycetota bacterium]
MIVDDRVVRALEGLIRVGNTHQRACLIGGQALRDLYDALRLRIGDDIPAVRASQDVDLLLSIGSDAESDGALHAVLQASWEPKIGRPATYVWREDRTVELDLATTYAADEPPARAVKISVGGAGRILAYRMIPGWLHDLNLMEPCHGVPLRRIGLERLRHTALLISKLLAVHASLVASALPDPPAWMSRLDRDLEDVLYLTDRRLRPSLWCAACAAKRAELHRHLDPHIADIVAAAERPSDSLTQETRARLRTVVDGLPLWWR